MHFFNFNFISDCPHFSIASVLEHEDRFFSTLLCLKLKNENVDPPSKICSSSKLARDGHISSNNNFSTQLNFYTF